MTKRALSHGFYQCGSDLRCRVTVCLWVVSGDGPRYEVTLTHENPNTWERPAKFERLTDARDYFNGMIDDECELSPANEYTCKCGQSLYEEVLI